MLQNLLPLPKKHYSWPLPFGAISDHELTEYARITGAISIHGYWVTEGVINRALRIAGAVGAEIAINYSPWHYKASNIATDMGPASQKELTLMRDRLTWIKQQIAFANQTYQTEVPVTTLMFDCERFYVRDDDPVWNNAITTKHDVTTEIAKTIFPDARIEWYARGAVHPAATPSGWQESKYFTLKEQGESFSCSLYRVPEIETTREIFRKTAALADFYYTDSVTPWVSLGAGYRRQVDQFHKYDKNWDYDLIYSWMLGREINRPWFGQPQYYERFAPWHMTQRVIFYPAPFDLDTPSWEKHFTAYVNGATGISQPS